MWGAMDLVIGARGRVASSRPLSLPVEVCGSLYRFRPPAARSNRRMMLNRAVMIEFKCEVPSCFKNS